jgi:hypothetical protein
MSWFTGLFLFQSEIRNPKSKGWLQGAGNKRFGVFRQWRINLKKRLINDGATCRVVAEGEA